MMSEARAVSCGSRESAWLVEQCSWAQQAVCAVRPITIRANRQSHQFRQIVVGCMLFSGVSLTPLIQQLFFFPVACPCAIIAVRYVYIDNRYS